MKWDEVCKDTLLQDLPYKVELNEWGNIVLSPASNRHGNLSFFSRQRKMDSSQLFPAMPARIEAEA